MNGENLKDVLEDAYKFYPDIKKSKIEFENAKKDETGPTGTRPTGTGPTATEPPDQT